MPLQLCAARFHLDKHALGPEQVGEFLPTLRLRAVALDEFDLRRAGLFRDAKLERRARLLHATVPERAEKMIEKNLRLALLVALERAGKGGELRKGGFDFCGRHKA